MYSYSTCRIPCTRVLVSVHVLESTPTCTVLEYMYVRVHLRACTYFTCTRVRVPHLTGTGRLLPPTTYLQVGIMCVRLRRSVLYELLYRYSYEYVGVLVPGTELRELAVQAADQTGGVSRWRSTRGLYAPSLWHHARELMVGIGG